jgi:hypothetical protein
MDQINNMIIVTPPKKITDNSAPVLRQKDDLDNDMLNQDLLKYTELERDLLKENDKLNKNFLESDYLVDFIIIANSQMLGDELDEFNKLLPKYDPRSGLKFNVENDFITLNREALNSYLEVKLPTTTSATLRLQQENTDIRQMVNSAGTTTITIKQSN